MAEREGFVPTEAELFRMPETDTTPEKPEVSDKAQQAIQGYSGPEARGAPTHRPGPDGELITTEKAELNHSAETTKEIEAGVGPNPSLNASPDDHTSPDDGTEDS